MLFQVNLELHHPHRDYSKQSDSQVNAQYFIATFVRGVTKIQCNMSLGGRNPLIMTIDIKAPSVAAERCRVTAQSVKKCLSRLGNRFYLFFNTTKKELYFQCVYFDDGQMNLFCCFIGILEYQVLLQQLKRILVLYSHFLSCTSKTKDFISLNRTYN